MSKKTHEKQAAVARARREAAAAAQQQQSRRNIGVFVILGIAIAAVAVGLFLRNNNDDDPGVTDPGPGGTEVPTDVPTGPDPTVTDPTVAVGNCAPATDRPQVADLQYDEPPAMALQPGVQYTALMHTNCGTIELELFAEDAPLAVNSFVFLAREGFYDGVIFHRVIETFMIQGGDPTGTGSGGPGYRFEDELDTVGTYGFGPGMLAMANSGPATNGSQFFIVHQNASHLQTHTVFGQVIGGMDVVDDIATTPTGPGDRPVEDVVILSIEVLEDGVPSDGGTAPAGDGEPTDEPTDDEGTEPVGDGEATDEDEAPEAP